VRHGSFFAVAVVLELVGWVFILQGIGVLPGSFMTGQPVWTVIGAVLVTVASALLVVVVRSRLTRE
jgi:hypothetical protein